MRKDDTEARRVLKSLGFDYIVYIAKDVSVVIPGTVQSVHRHKIDADADAARLSHMYRNDESFAVEAI